MTFWRSVSVALEVVVAGVSWVRKTAVYGVDVVAVVGERRGDFVDWFLNRFFINLEMFLEPTWVPKWNQHR